MFFMWGRAGIHGCLVCDDEVGNCLLRVESLACKLGCVWQLVSVLGGVKIYEEKEKQIVVGEVGVVRNSLVRKPETVVREEEIIRLKHQSIIYVHITREEQLCCSS